MTDKTPDDMPTPDPVELSKNMARVAEQSQRLVQEFLEKQQDASPGPVDPLNISEAFMALTTQMMQHPAQVAQAQMDLWQSYVQLWQSTAQRMLGHTDDSTEPPAAATMRSTIASLRLALASTTVSTMVTGLPARCAVFDSASVSLGKHEPP